MSIRRFILMASVDPFRPETRQLLARMTTQPSVARATLIDQTIRGLIDAGLWDQFDILYFLAAHDAQAARLNWKADAFNLTIQSGSPVFTTDGGYRANPSTLSGVLTTGWAPISSAVNWALGDAALSAWADESGSSTDGGALVSGGAAAIVSPYGSGSSDGLTVVGINQSNAVAITPPASPPVGLITGTREGGDAKIYYNGGFVQNLSGSETGFATTAVTMLNASAFRLRFASAGAGRDAAAEEALYDIVAAYLAGL